MSTLGYASHEILHFRNLVLKFNFYGWWSGSNLEFIINERTLVGIDFREVIEFRRNVTINGFDYTYTDGP